ncbi:MAG: hypothetical protein CVT92_14335 [Bacteroidetes bacterium HGW-Bacteroidetes-1]|jgi:hypothetical protein|nr:MAG: hypothetical protein CVT92_14335 [Bacteroidetes bacterium HGW-Bacteroidetes-1]
MRLDNTLRKVTFFIAALFFGISLMAQTGVDSPYSRFGIGNIDSRSVNARQQAMGGIGNAIGSNRFVNPSNPASYAKFDSLSFLFNAGFNASNVTYRTTTQTEKGSYAQLAYFSAGFPVTSWWKAGVGLLPYSRVGFNVVVPGTTAQNLRYNKAFEGHGGLNQLYFGNAFQLAKNLSVGVNATYVFGRNVTSSLLYFPDSSYIASTKVESRILASDFKFDYGLLYTAKVNEKTSLHMGLVYGQKINLNVKREYLIQSQFGGIDGDVSYVLDTIFYTPSEKGKLVIPPQIGFGLALEKSNSWLLGADFNWQNWEKYQIQGANDSLINSWNTAIGGQFTPNHTSISGYWKRVTYRGGARYNQTYLKISGQPINEFGISFGVGLPLPRSMTTIDLSVEVGRRGTTANDLIRETFINFTAGVSIYERWFVKRRYN